MKKLSDIRRQINPCLRKIEQERQDTLANIKKAKKWYLLPILLLLLAIVSFAANKIPLGIGLLFVSIVGLIVVAVFKVSPYQTNYISNFKKGAFSTFVEASYPQVYYAPDNYLPSSLFDKSKLFGSYDSYSGEDYFEGKTEGGCSFKFSELHVTKTEVTSNGDGGVETSARTIFDGLFFVLNVPDRVSGQIQVLPDSVENVFGKMGKIFQKKIGAFFQRSSVVYLEDHPEFEKEFVVYSKDEEEVYRILTPNLLQAIYDLRYKWNTRLSISFIEHQVYVAMPTSKDFFRPNIKYSVTDDTLLKELYDELALCFAVVEDLSMEHQPEESRSLLNSGQSVNFNRTKSKDNPFLL
ncbi:DUF3137 domain-containing protein [Aureispira sp. CCB-E]|uniref:DUF3137 domain-containing protein n=1 Tax=Aureispira sp. CCB-E TaxID=3051121 RepID=UPI002868B0C9|nr:DUF3137 domain-containing protein [Aureispira sp. CCB-E]WMX12843.1 DUF3137 domain-containing protein [Aureispira sp. CCB-E]